MFQGQLLAGQFLSPKTVKQSSLMIDRDSLVTSRIYLRKVRLVKKGWILVISTELFERSNQVVACPITLAAHMRPSACVGANWL